MNWLSQLFSRRRLYSDLSAEMRTHLDEKIDTLISSGMSREEATRTARREFGNVTLLEERSREVWQWPSLESFFADIRFALRMLRKSPGFTAVAVLTLALGIGANTAIFSVVNSVLLKRLPFSAPQKIVVLSGNATVFLSRLASSPKTPGKLSPTEAARLADPVRWEQHVQSFEAAAAYQPGRVNLTGTGQPESVRAAQVSHEFFRVLDVEPAIGADFSANANDTTPSVLLSWALWQRRYDADPNIVGKMVVVNGRGIAVLGVMPKSFQFPAETEIWVPAGVGGDTIDRGIMFSSLIARICPSISFSQAQAEMDTITERVRNSDAILKKFGGPGIILTRLQDNLTGSSRTPLLLLLAAVGCVLLIACANVANLVFCRGLNRYREVAVRSALGAGRSRLIRQLLTESLLIAFIGGLFGVFLALCSLRFLVAILPVALPKLTPIAIDGRVLAVTTLLICGTGLLFGLAPALGATKIELSKSLKDGLAVTGTRAHSRIRGSLLVTQIALSVVLLVGGGLMVRTLVNLLDIHPGFDARNVLTLNISLPDATYHTAPQINNYFGQVFDRLKSVPSVQFVGAINYLPLGQTPSFGLLISTEGHPVDPSHPFDSAASFFTVAGNYFQALHIPLLQGRYFSDQDGGPTATRVAIVSESFANTFWPHHSAVGRQFRTSQTYLVVGVVGDVRHDSLQQPKELEMYLPEQQTATSSMDLVIRTASAPAALASSIREAIRTVDKNQPITTLQTMKTVVNHSLSSQWSHMLLLSLFGLVALVLASIGCYALVAYSVAQRTHEIGLRVALGARPQHILSMVLRQGLLLATVGIAFGVVIALALTRFMSSLLFGVSTADPLTFACVSILLVFVALLACYIPARRAMKVDPMVALRYE